MKYLKIFEDFYRNRNTYMKSGITHDIHYVDDEYVLKVPQKNDLESLKDFEVILR